MEWYPTDSFDLHKSTDKTSLGKKRKSESPLPEKLIELPKLATSSDSDRYSNTTPTLFPVNKSQANTNTDSPCEEDLFIPSTDRNEIESALLQPDLLVEDNILFGNEVVTNSDNISSPQQPSKELSNNSQEPKSNLELVHSEATPPQAEDSTTAKSKIKRTTSLKRKKSRRSPTLLSLLFVYIIRLLIVGVGVGAIAGTILSNLDYTAVNATDINSKPTELPQSQEPPPATQDKLVPLPLILNKELTSLKDKFQALAAKYPQLQSGAFFVDLDNGAYVDVDADSIFSAASTIKIPILVAFFEDVDAGKIHLDEKLTMTPETIARGSGSMQYRKPGTQFSALETATKMIVISDNTATNMLILRLGGAQALNQRFLDWGMKVTAIRNPLPDLKGTNTTSPKDLANLLARIERGELVSLRSRDRILGIMKRTRTKTLLPRGLDKGAIIAHKTGDIGSILGDAGVVDMPNGKRYIAAVMVKRPHNDYRARTLIQEISKTAYQHFKWYLPNSESKKQT